MSSAAPFCTWTGALGFPQTLCICWWGSRNSSQSPLQRLNILKTGAEKDWVAALPLPWNAPSCLLPAPSPLRPTYWLNSASVKVLPFAMVELDATSVGLCTCMYQGRIIIGKRKWVSCIGSEFNSRSILSIYSTGFTVIDVLWLAQKAVFKDEARVGSIIGYMYCKVQIFRRNLNNLK